MAFKKTGSTQLIASAKTGISERTARRIDTGECSGIRKQRNWRTRKDPLSLIWTDKLEPMLALEPKLLPATLLDWVNDNCPEIDADSITRTLQRRVKQWKALYGPGKEVMFLQNKQPGQLGLSDFTQLKRVQITIAGKIFSHLLYHYRLAYSGYSYVKVIFGGESFAALSSGLQDALWQCGGVPHEHRTDSLSAAFNNMSEKEELTKRYASLCRHYRIIASRNNPGKSHENGAVESAHGHFKRKLEQALLLNGSSNFNNVEAYQAAINQIVRKINRACQTRFEQERAHLQALPLRRTNDYLEHYVKVISSSTITIKRVTYSVPSRLIGEKLVVHIYDDHLDVYCGHVKALTLTRLYTSRHQRLKQISYKHVINSLVRKPGAFRYSQLRDELLPTADYQQIWQLIDTSMPAKESARYIVNLLHIAANHDCEDSLGRYVLDYLILKSIAPSMEQCRLRFIKQDTLIPAIASIQHSLSDYNQLLSLPSSGATA